MRWYLSGPMTGLPDLNRPAFQHVTALIRAVGHDVLNPAELCPPGITWKAVMHYDLTALKTAQGVICLPAWSQTGWSLTVLKSRDLAPRVGIESNPLGILLNRWDAASAALTQSRNLGSIGKVSSGHSCGIIDL